jgi:outer membrane protein OmpA-like peptidoglycan-associated protein
MKKIFLLLGLVCISANVFAQKSEVKKADLFFETYQYVSAIEAYKKIVDANKADYHVYKNLADSYYNIFNIEEASKWYKEAVNLNKDTETIYRYAQTLKSLGKYEEANKQMDVFDQLNPNDSRSIEHKKNPNYISKIENSTKLFDIENASFSKDNDDFGAILTDDNMVYFISTRGTTKKDTWSNYNYTDIFKVIRNADGTFSDVNAVSDLNTPYHDGPLTISADGKTMFLARNEFNSNTLKKDKVNKLKIGQLGIYKAQIINGKWQVVESLTINSKDYSVSHPSLSRDGKTLFFTSNMPGGIGETDIWKMAVLENGYGKPENLGPTINTVNREAFPFIADDNTLYYASDGKQGFGGLDIFKVNLDQKNEVINVGKPMNSEKDDFSFSLNSKHNIGYFSSNRSGRDLIYSAIPVCISNLEIIVKDVKTKKFVPQAKVVLLDDKQNILHTKMANADGQVDFSVSCDLSSSVQVTAQNYEIQVVATGKFKPNNNQIIIDLTPVEVVITDTEVILKNVYFDFNKFNITEAGALELNKLVKVMNDHPTMKILVKSHTDSKGSANYNLNLSENRAQSTVQYIISKGISKDRISGKGFGSSELKVDCKDNCTEEDHAKNRRSEFLIVK